jgi:hypothetical protein
MAKQNLPKYTLTKSKEKKGWELKENKTKKVVHLFRTKKIATKGGALEKQLGSKGGSVRIEKEHGGFDEERTFPRSKDPKKSPG